MRLDVYVRECVDAQLDNATNEIVRNNKTNNILMVIYNVILILYNKFT